MPSNIKSGFNQNSTRPIGEISDHNFNWFIQLLRYLNIGLLDPRWETRHGCAQGLKSILHGLYPLGTSLTAQSDPKGDDMFPTIGCLLPLAFMEELLCSGISVMILDQFIDYEEGTCTMAPVRESCAQLVSYVAVIYPERFCFAVFLMGLKMAQHKRQWTIMYGGLLLLKYMLPLLRPDDKRDTTYVTDILNLLEHTLRSSVDDVVHASLQLVCSLQKAFLGTRRSQQSEETEALSAAGKAHSMEVRWQHNISSIRTSLPALVDLVILKTDTASSLSSYLPSLCPALSSCLSIETSKAGRSDAHVLCRIIAGATALLRLLQRIEASLALRSVVFSGLRQIFDTLSGVCFDNELHGHASEDSADGEIVTLNQYMIDLCFALNNTLCLPYRLAQSTGVLELEPKLLPSAPPASCAIIQDSESLSFAAMNTVQFVSATKVLVQSFVRAMRIIMLRSVRETMERESTSRVRSTISAVDEVAQETSNALMVTALCSIQQLSNDDIFSPGYVTTSPSTVSSSVIRVFNKVREENISHVDPAGALGPTAPSKLSCGRLGRESFKFISNFLGAVVAAACDVMLTPECEADVIRSAPEGGFDNREAFLCDSLAKFIFMPLINEITKLQQDYVSIKKSQMNTTTPMKRPLFKMIIGSKRIFSGSDLDSSKLDTILMLIEGLLDLLPWLVYVTRRRLRASMPLRGVYPIICIWQTISFMFVCLS